MATFTPPYADPGAAKFQILDTYLMNFLIAGSKPELEPAFSFPMAQNSSFAQFTVVGLDGTGKLTKATTTGVQAIGVIAHAVALGATGTANGQVFYSGCFNQDALVWDASFTTDAQKQAAFRGAPTPTTIIIAKR